jgi:hypothetical protein
MSYHVVNLIPQESGNTCWAAATAMLVDLQYGSGFVHHTRTTRRAVVTPMGVAVHAGLGLHYARDGMLPSTHHAYSCLAQPWDLTVESGLSNLTEAQWQERLDRHGPMVVRFSMPQWDHTAVVEGVRQGELAVADPWPILTGSRYWRRIDRLSGQLTMIHA